jgi:hypothetical protein
MTIDVPGFALCQHEAEPKIIESHDSETHVKLKICLKFLPFGNPLKLHSRCLKQCYSANMKLSQKS